MEHPWEIGACIANGIRIHSLRTGGEKPPVLLLHGLMTSGACWTPVARALSAKYDVVMPDARGHGSSEDPKKGYTYETLAEDLLGLIEALRLVKPVVVGHSMGGMTAAVAACKDPSKLERLVLVDPTFLTPERQQEVYESDVAAQHRAYLAQPPELRGRNSGRSSEINDLLAEARMQTSLHAFDILTPPNPNFLELVQALALPTLLVTGGKSPVISPDAAAELAALNPNISLVTIPKAGHGIPFDNPEGLFEALNSFLLLR